MTTYAEVTNSTGEVIRFVNLENDSAVAAVAHKFGPSFTTRLVKIVDENGPEFDPSVFQAVPSQVLSGDTLTRSWTLSRLPEDTIVSNIETVILRKIGGIAGIAFLARLAHEKAPTDIDLAKVDSILAAFDTADQLKENASTITAVDSAIATISVEASPGVSIKP